MGRIQRAWWAWSRSVGWKGTAVFLYLWLMLGFATGTLVLLLGPARWLTGFVRAGGWGQGAEDALMIGVILTYLALSFLLALYLARLLLSYRAGALKTGIVLLVTAAAVAALWGWMNPALSSAPIPTGSGSRS